MRRVLTALVAVGALVAFAAAPAGAQEELGLETNILEGQPGEIVAGQVDTDDIAENCVTQLEAFQARFGELFEIFNDFSEGGFASRFFDVTNQLVENHDQLAYLFTGLAALGISANLGGAAEDALPQTFVFTFADIATQEPVGEMGNFDPATGEGLVTVPDIEPGQWAVAAACVGPILDDLDALEAGIRANGAFLQELGVPLPENPQDPFGDPALQEFMQEFLGSEATGLALIIEFLGVIGPDLLEPIVTPDALGAVIFCILDENGECPTDVVPPGPDDDDDDDAEPADAVVIQPDFTG
jgi:hypothetical protein